MNIQDYKELINNCQNIKILYVEDDLELQQQTVKLLKNFFNNIIVANDGQDGLNKFTEEDNIDLIFTDVQMPNMDGLDMVSEIRKINNDIPIIVFSAYTDTKYFLEAIKSGIHDYLIKPVDIDELSIAIKRIVNNQNNNIKLENNFSWNNMQKTLYQNTIKIALTKNEIKLFDFLTTFPNRIFSSHDIEIAIFNDFISDNKRIRNLISRLKQKLNYDLIENLYSQGYKLKLDIN